MRVKRLEIQGFKSFKDKTVIHFDHGITGIVGPNGCGKSNIVDAFFWVMGEQSYKHMRGTGSEDLIFNGSSKYSPLGLAEATLVMETDVVDTENAPAGATAQDLPVHLRSKEISVTRRLYRSGEGEYFINGVQARLKDIQELFMDTGVGAKGYSVIEQGQIGKIVNAKPEERRLLIEEAAGIAKYKARKKESLRKMEATQANLSRLTDVIQEIERNLGSLERQAQKARQYKKYKDELLDKEMTWGRRKNQVLRQKIEALQNKKLAAEQEIAGLRAELQTAENAIETDRISQLTQTKAAEELQTTIQQLSDELTRERSALDLSRRRQGDLASQLQSLENEKHDLEVSIHTETERVAQHEIEVQAFGNTFEAASRDATEKDAITRNLRQSTQAARQQLESTKRELMNGITQSSELTSKAAALMSRIDSASALTVRLEQQALAHSERLTQAREETEKARASADAIKSEREKAQVEITSQRTNVETQSENLRKLETERTQSMRELMQLKSKLQSLEELALAHEGLADGPKAALEWASANGADKNLLALADALEVENGYDAATTGWLENKIDSLLAQDASFALSALNQLRDQDQGRASIQLSPAAPSNTGNTSVLELPKEILRAAGFSVSGELSQHVKISENLEPGIRQAAAHLIANVLVVESFEPMKTFIQSGAASRLAQLGPWSIVSVSGDVYDAQNSVLRGGSLGNDGSANVLKRKRAISDLQTQVAHAESAHQALEQSLASAKHAFDQANIQLQKLQSDLQTLQVQGAAYDRDVHQMVRVLNDMESQLGSIESEIQHSQDEATHARSERENIEAELATIIAARSGLEAKVASGDLEVAAQDAEVSRHEAELQTARIHEASLRERAQSLKRELDASRSLIADRMRRVAEINRTLDRASQERAQFSGGESDLARRIEELTLILGTNREKLSLTKDQLEQSSAKLNASLERIKELHKIGDQKTTEANQLALEVEKHSSDLAHLIQNLEEKYGPGCLERPVTSPIQEEMSEPVVTAEMTAEEEQALGEEVERLRERIRRLGEVNVMAIEEFEELKKRYDYLTGEKTDLDRSIENLQDAIEHINKTSEERFKKAFEAIADRFERLFPIIFGGGQANLSLVYPEGSTDILEAGVDILAQPPGKKIVHIGLLSGGEKALTAVSLIFAIFMVKPSPFCVLDEVDAPLDDANIGKFNALLREMAAKSQFILITHNKKTMELNDTLYGVTMEEPGVSKMVSIEMH